MAYRTLAYEAIADTLRRAIEGRTLPEGIVLLEGPIAALFSASRSPVKRALAMLEDEGLVRQFEGRGMLVGATGGPRREKVTAAMLGLEAEEAGVHPRTFAWQTFYYDFEQTVILRAVFGSARINELALARHYKVGRTVASDILNHAARTGLVTVDEKSRWLINPLDADRFRDLYELRALLEPAALTTAIPRMPLDVVRSMRARLVTAFDNIAEVESQEFDKLEEDLHIDLLQFSSNGEIIEALRRTRCVLVAGKHIQHAIRAGGAIDAFMNEHIDVMDAILGHDPGHAGEKLMEHIVRSGEKAQARLRDYLTRNDPAPVSYLLD